MKTKQMVSMVLLLLAFVWVNAQQSLPKKPPKKAQYKTYNYVASFENSNANFEEQLFYNVAQTRTPIVQGKTAQARFSGSTTTNKYCAKLQPNTKMGPAIMLKVDSGDYFNIGVEGLLKLQNNALQNPKENTLKSPTQNAITAISNVTNKVAGTGKLGSIGISSLGSSFNPLNIIDFIKPETNENTPMLGGFINWVMLNPDLSFDKTINEVGFVKMTEPDKTNQLAKGNIQIKKSGYILIFLSNSSNEAIYFDNMNIEHNVPNADAGFYIITEDNYDITPEQGNKKFVPEVTDNTKPNKN